MHLADTIGELYGNATRFDSENWREVVPVVRTFAANLDYAAVQLEEALGYK